MVNRVVNGFLGLGIEPGGKVALMLPNCPAFLFAWFALKRIGAVCVQLNVALKGEGLAYQIDQADCVALVADDAYLDALDAIADRLPKLRHTVMIGTDGGAARLTRWPGVESLHFGELLARPERAPGVAVDFRALATIVYVRHDRLVEGRDDHSHHYWYEIWRRPGFCGKALNGYDVRLVDENDNEGPRGRVGEFVVRPERPHLGTTGYYRQPEATLELFRNLRIHTGDLATQDEDGYFYYVDRKKQALRRRGENISSFEVEAVISAHPGVAESCVVGVPSELGEDEVKAIIVLKPGHRVLEAELIGWCEPRLAYFAIPRYIAFRAHLPKTPSQRVEKYRLRDEGVTANCWDREQAGIVLAR